jgi:hypothetical protein
MDARERLSRVSEKVIALSLKIADHPEMLEPPLALGTLVQLECVRAELAQVRDMLQEPDN